MANYNPESPEDSQDHETFLRDHEYLIKWVSSSGTFLHFSLTRMELGTQLEGRKFMNKEKQRVGQSAVDEIFEEVRKKQFPEKPSLFTSLWVMETLDTSVPRKALKESKEPSGYLYEVKPLSTPVLVDPWYEVEACQAYTQSKLRGGALEDFIKECAVKFWNAEDAIQRDNHYFLCREGAKVVGEWGLISSNDVKKRSVE